MRSLVFHHPRGRKSKNRPHKSPRTIAPIVYATARPLRPLTNYPSPTVEEGGARGRGRGRGRGRPGDGGNLLPEVSIFSGGLRCVYGNSRPPSSRGSFPKPGGIRTRRQFAGEGKNARGGRGSKKRVGRFRSTILPGQA